MVPRVIPRSDTFLGVEGEQDPGRPGGVTRRVVLRDGSAVALAVMAGGFLPGLDRVAVAVEPGKH